MKESSNVAESMVRHTSSAYSQNISQTRKNDITLQQNKAFSVIAKFRILDVETFILQFKDLTVEIVQTDKLEGFEGVQLSNNMMKLCAIELAHLSLVNKFMLKTIKKHRLEAASVFKRVTARALFQPIQVTLFANIDKNDLYDIAWAVPGTALNVMLLDVIEQLTDCHNSAIYNVVVSDDSDEIKYEKFSALEVVEQNFLTFKAQLIFDINNTPEFIQKSVQSGETGQIAISSDHITTLTGIIDGIYRTLHISLNLQGSNIFAQIKRIAYPEA